MSIGMFFFRMFTILSYTFISLIVFFWCSLFLDIPQNEETLIQEIIETEGLKYIAGYVARKFKIKYPSLGDETRRLELDNDHFDWIQFLSNGYLIYPSDDLINVANIMEKQFVLFHGEFGLSK